MIYLSKGGGAVPIRTRGGGYLVERWVRGCAAQIGCFFDLSGLAMAPFYLKIGLNIGRVFAKCVIFNEFVFWFTYRLSKVPVHPNLHCKKYWLVKKRAFKKQMV